MEEHVFYPFKEKTRLVRIIASILLIGFGYIFYAALESFFYWYVYAVFFSAAGSVYLFVNLKSYFGRRPGLYLDPDGFFIKTSATAINIKWKEIKSFLCLDRGDYSLVSVILFDDEKFLRQSNFYVRWLRERALKKYGTSILIVVNFYRVSRSELLAELNYRLEKYH